MKLSNVMQDAGPIAFDLSEDELKSISGGSVSVGLSENTGGFAIRNHPVSGGFAIRNHPVSGGFAIRNHPVSGGFAIRNHPVKG